MNDVTVFSTEVCPKCLKLKRLLKENEIEYKEERMDTTENIAELRFNGVFTNNAPVLAIGETFYIHNDLFDGSEIKADFVKEILSLE